MLYIGAKRSLLKQRSNNAPTWTPAANFSSGELGIWYDFSTFTGLFQDSAGISPATATGQQVGLALDLSGRGSHAIQATSGAKPTISNNT